MSVRRTVRATAAGRAAELPARLRLCTIEDWVTPDERPAEWWFTGTLASGDRLADIWAWLTYTAWLRRGEAHQQWAKDQGLTRSEFCGAHAYDIHPRWRDWPAFRQRMLEVGDL